MRRRDIGSAPRRATRQKQSAHGRRSVRVALEHGGFGTTGDFAMLVNVLRKLRQQIPGATIAIRRGRNEKQVTLHEVDEYFEGLQTYYRNTWNRFYNGWHKVVPQAMRGAALNGLVILATIRLLIGALVARAIGTLICCPAGARSFAGAAMRSDIFYVAGNGGMTDAFLYGGVYAPCAETLLARTLGKKVLFSGQGVGPLESPLGRAFAREAFRRAELVTVREKESLLTLRKLGVDGSHISCTGDDAHDLPIDPNATASARERLLRLFDPAPKIIAAVNVRWASYAQTADGSLKEPLDVCRLLSEVPGMGIVFVPMLTDCEEEIASYHRMVKELHGRIPACVAPYQPLKPEEIKTSLAAVDLAVGYSYHFLVFALSSCVPALGVYETAYYKQKLEGVMERYAMPDATIGLGTNGWHAQFTHKLQELLNNREGVRMRLRERQKTLAEQVSLPIRVLRRLAEAGR